MNYNEELKKYGYTPLEEVRTTYKKYEVQDSLGYVYLVALAQLREGSMPRLASVHNPYTKQNISNMLRLAGQPQQTVLSEYTGAYDQMEIECLLHGSYTRSYNDLIRGRFCPKCAAIATKTKIRLKKLAKLGLCPIGDFLGDRVHTKDIQGYKYAILYQHYGNLPLAKFRRSNPYWRENILLWMKLNNVNIDLVDTEFHKCGGSFTFECPIHGKFHRYWSLFVKGHTCSKCNEGTTK